MDYNDLAQYFADTLGISNVGIGKVLTTAQPRQVVWVEVKNLRGKPFRVQATAGNLCFAGHSCAVFRDSKNHYFAFDAIASYGVNIQNSQFRRLRQIINEKQQLIFAPLLLEVVQFFAPALIEKLEIYVPALIELDKKRDKLIAILYKFTVENDPVSCECQKSFDRAGNVVIERCDSGGQYSSAGDALAASEPIFPDPNKRYFTLYASAGMKNFLAYHQVDCNNSFQKANCFITGSTHPAWDDVLEWASTYELSVNPGSGGSGAYIQGNLPLFPISNTTPGITYSLIVGGFYGGARHVSSNGWMGMNFTIFKIENGEITGQFGLCWSYFKMAYPGESPTGPQYDSGAFNPSGFALNNGSPIELVFSEANLQCSPYGNGNPNQGEPPVVRQRNKNSVHFYLAGSRNPTFLKKINSEELVKAYVVKTGINKEVVALTIGNTSTFCKTIYLVLNGDSISSSIIAAPTKPNIITSDWKAQYIDYSPPYSFNISGTPNYYLPLPTGNYYTDPERTALDANIQSISGLTPSPTEIIFKLRQIGLVKQENQTTSLELSVAFESNLKFSTYVCVTKLNPEQPERRVKIDEVIPANKTGVQILSSSPFLERETMELQYNNGLLGCTLQPIYSGEVIEGWFSGYSSYQISRGIYVYSFANGEGSNLVLRNCNSEVVATIEPLYGGNVNIYTQSIVGYCEL